MCFMSDMSTMGSALDNAVIPRYDAGMNPMDKRELYETTAGLSGILCGGPVSSVEEPLAKDDGELCLCLDPF
ncbi:hypothetical protein CN088_33825, partial [Sinorhizobium meliloti]